MKENLVISENLIDNLSETLPKTLQDNLTSKEVAEILGISKTRVFQLVKSGKLLPITCRKVGNNKSYIFDRAEVEKWKDENKKGFSTYRKGENNQFTSCREAEERPLQNDQEHQLLIDLETAKIENKQLLIEVGKYQGYAQAKDEQLRQTQNLLSERAETLFEKEAKIKELEAQVEQLKKPFWVKWFYKK